MLWFFESFFPVVLIAFLLYWQIKAVGTKTTQRLEPAASRIVRVLAFVIVIVLLATTRIPLRWLYLQLWPSGIWPFWVGACSYPRRPALPRLGARAPRQQLEPLRNHQAGPRTGYHRPLCRGPSPHLHWHSGRVSWHRECALPGARGHRLRPGVPRAPGQAPPGGGLDAFPIWGDVCQTAALVPYLF